MAFGTVDGSDRIAPGLAVAVLDPLGDLTWASPAAADLVGRPLEELRGSGWLDCILSEDLARVRATWAGAVGAAAPDDQLAFEVRLAPSRRWCRGQLAPVPATDDGRGAWLIALEAIDEPEADLDQRLAAVTARAEDDLRRARERHYLDLTTLAGGIAHDVNNLATAIVGHASLASEDAPQGSLLEADLSAITTAAMRASQLAQQLLAFAGRGRVVVEPLDVNELVAAGAGSVGTPVELRLGSDLPPVRGDAAQLRSVVMELVRNAAEATPVPSAGRSAPPVVIRTSRTPDDPTIVLIEVVDAGEGMDAAVRARIFEPFFSTRSRGRGLGLAAASGIVLSHAGAIEVDSAPGAGTRVAVYLPAEPTPMAATAATATTPPSVLFVEDERVLVALAERSLGRAGYTVEAALDGPTALALLADPARDYGVIVLDMTLPGGVEGADLYAAAVRHRPTTPVVIASGWSATEIDARISGYHAFLPKAYTPSELNGAVARALESAGRLEAEETA